MSQSSFPRFLPVCTATAAIRLFVAVDGACRNNGRPNARAALGIFFIKRCYWNKSELLPQPDAASQRAELCAVLRALQLLLSFIAYEWKASITTGKTLNRVIIKSDSDYVVRSMTEYIFKWLENDYENARGEPVQNQDLFKKIVDMMHKLDQEKNLKVLFWKVGREHNKDADGLANTALDTAGALTWDHRQGIEHEVEDWDSRRVWRWHRRMAHVSLETLKRTLRVTTGIDVTEEQIQREIDKGASCATCVSIGHGPDGLDP